MAFGQQGSSVFEHDSVPSMPSNCSGVELMLPLDPPE